MTGLLVAFFQFLKLPTILFLCVVCPIWLSKHYKARAREAATLTEQEQTMLEDMARIAGRIESRVATLEKILDAEDPKWKERM